MESSAPTLSFLGKPKILVAGGASFLGSLLCEELVKLAAQVICVDNLTTGKKENLKKCLALANFFFWQKNINDKNFINETREQFGKIDYIFHLAGEEEYQDDTDGALETLLVNALGTANLLNLTKQDKAKFLLVSSLSVFSENFSQKLSPSSFQEAKRYAEALVLKYHKKFNLNTRVVRLLDVFGPRMGETGNVLRQMFFSAANNNSINIAGDGLQTVYPLFVKDAVSAILTAMFGQKTNGQVFNLYGEKTNLLSLAHEIKKNHPNTEIIFTKEEKFWENPVFLPPVSFKTKTTLAEAISETLNWIKGSAICHPEPPFNRGEGSSQAKPDARSPWSLDSSPLFFQKRGGQNDTWGIFPKFTTTGMRKLKRIFLSLTAAVILFFVPTLSFLFFTMSGLNNLQSAQKLALAGDLIQAQKKTEDAGINFSWANNLFSAFSWTLPLVGKNSEAKDITFLLSAGEKLSQISSYLFSSAKDYSLAAKMILGEDQGQNLIDQLTVAKGKLEKANNELEFLSAQIATSQINEAVLPKSLLKEKNISWKVVKTKLKELQSKVSSFRALSLVLQEIIGINGKKTYLVLFANNMEIRPTGGFLGSYGLLTLDKGKLSDFKIEDVYSADGQLTGHVEPPVALRKHLGQPHWYLRDSNWSPDFSQVSQKAEWFLEKEIGLKVDATILMDLNASQNILAAIGPVFLSDYNETIDHTNLFNKATLYSEKNFFPGSLQKRDFLGTLGRKMLDQIITSSSQKFLPLGLSILKSLEEKHLAFYFHNEQINTIFNNLNWTGALGENLCQGNCLADYLMLIEANLGVNKANFYVKRNIFQKIEIDKSGKVRESLTLTYKNDSQSEVFPAGTYKNFLRILVPQDSVLENIQIDGQDVGFNVGAPNLERKEREGILEVEEENSPAGGTDKNSFGFLVTIPPQSQKMVTITYILKNNLIFDKNSIYRLLLPKQMGVQNDNYNLEIVYPQFLLIKNINQPEVSLNPGKVSLSGVLDKDKLITLEFGQK